MIEDGDVDELAQVMQGFVNKRFHFSEAKVKQSIDRLYEDTYYQRVEKTLAKLV
ncbi:hypothetical protein [Lactiplantibacillus plantarum]|uniref:hypothetical protein n=1 Tax=Lactiplantibacillus plantarum TaxID=1590 RepID=UPI002AA6F631|nr:hypothetical protein [Lactiplantibacillus plantarum]